MLTTLPHIHTYIHTYTYTQCTLFGLMFASVVEGLGVARGTDDWLNPSVSGALMGGVVGHRLSSSSSPPPPPTAPRVVSRDWRVVLGWSGLGLTLGLLTGLLNTYSRMLQASMLEKKSKAEAKANDVPTSENKSQNER